MCPRSIAHPNSTQTSCRAWATSATGCTERYDEAPHGRAPRAAEAGESVEGRPRRAVEDRPDMHRAEQHPDAGLPPRRDHGAPDVRRGDLPAADGRSAVAV